MQWMLGPSRRLSLPILVTHLQSLPQSALERNDLHLLPIPHLPRNINILLQPFHNLLPASRTNQHRRPLHLRWIGVPFLDRLLEHGSYRKPPLVYVHSCFECSTGELGEREIGSGMGVGEDIPPQSQNVSGSELRPSRCFGLTLSLFCSAPSKSGAMTIHSRIGPEVVAIALRNWGGCVKLVRG